MGRVLSFGAEMKSLLLALLLVAGCDVAAGLIREYIYNHSALTWDEARTFCREKYRDLATITNTEENNRVYELSEASGWIGLHKTSSVWEWSDGERTSFFDWFSSNQQAGCVSTGYYVLSNEYYKRFWISLACENLNYFYCYQFLVLVKEKKTYEEALEFCRTKYTGLAVMTSALSLKQMKLEMLGTETEGVWTGLRFVNRRWLWVNKEQPRYPQWGQLGDLAFMPSCPAPSYHCGAFNTVRNAFKNYNCNEKLNFLCYWA